MHDALLLRPGIYGVLPIIGVVAAQSLILVLLGGGPMIAWLKRAGVGQRVRDDGPQRHLAKEGTPTMGGILIVGAALIATAAGGWRLWRAMWSEGPEWVVVSMIGMTAAFALIGLLDDRKKVAKGRSLGLKARQKLLLQVVFAAAFVSVLVWRRLTLMNMLQAAPLAGHASSWLPLPLWAAFWVLAIVATSNAVNLADGLDGLASGLCLISFAGFVIFGLASRHWDAGVAVFAAALGAACLGFLWFNRHPARVFMGDVGSLALGAGLAGMAAMLDYPLALIGLCVVPFIEEASVIAQVVSFKTTGKRILKMSPIHHHFELSGWSERRVVVTFWVVALLAAGLTLAAYNRFG